jgi:ABC-type branched-subunit amino acid transport system substrate-binding protein
VLVLVLAAVASGSAFGSKQQSTKFKKPDIWISNLVPINTATLNYPVLQETMKVYQKWINAQGGIAGHRLQIFFCDSLNQPQAAQDCVRQAADKKVVADVGSFDGSVGDTIMAALEQAKIPLVGGFTGGIGGKEGQNPYAFMLGNSTLSITAVGKQAALDGCKDIVATAADTAAAGPIFAEAANGVKAGGGKTPKNVLLPLVPGDLTSQVARMAGADCLIQGLGVAHAGAVLKAMKQQGMKMKVYGSPNWFTLYSQYPELVVGAKGATGGPPIVAPAWATYRAAWKKYSTQPNLPYDTNVPEGGWISAVVLTKVIQSMKPGTPINAANVYKRLNTTRKLTTGGLTPILNFTKPWVQNPTATRFFNRTAVIGVVKADGSVGCQDPKCSFVDVTSAHFGVPAKK